MGCWFQPSSQMRCAGKSGLCELTESLRCRLCAEKSPATVFSCMNVVYPYIPVHTLIFPYILLCTTPIYPYIPLYTPVYPYIPLHTIIPSIYPYIMSAVSIHYLIPLINRDSSKTSPEPYIPEPKPFPDSPNPKSRNP